MTCKRLASSSRTRHSERASVILNEVKDLTRSSARSGDEDYVRRTALDPSTPLADSLRSATVLEVNDVVGVPCSGVSENSI
jgi:hypothetical protein